MKPVEEKTLQVFNSEEFGEIRTAQIDGEPWFVGRDVATALGYNNTKAAISDHVDEEDKQILQRSENATFENHDTASTTTTNFAEAEIPNRGLTIINESGLYSLVLSSKLESAKKFKRWITHEVIPAIRKHGAYIEPVTLDKIISCPDFGIRLLTELKNEQAKRKTLEEENAVMQPKAEYFDDLVDRNTLTSFRDTAKEFGVKPKEFLAYLIDHGYVYRDGKGALMPYAEKNDGLFSVRECRSEKNKWSGVQTLITPKGRETFRLLYARQ